MPRYVPQDATHMLAQIRGLVGDEFAGRLSERIGRTADTITVLVGRMEGGPRTPGPWSRGTCWVRALSQRQDPTYAGAKMAAILRRIGVCIH